MKAICYSTKAVEKDLLIKANDNKHDITLISDALKAETACFAKGNQAVIVFTNDEVTAPIIHKLSGLGIQYILTRSVGTDHIDIEAAKKLGIQVANIPAYSPEAIAEHTLALALALSRHLIQADQQCREFNFCLDHLTGFNFFGKTIGLIGLGHIGTATAAIFNGLGCKVLGYDIKPQKIKHVEIVALDTLLRESDVISLHTPLTPATTHMINEDTLRLMKDGVMIINTARGDLIKTTAALAALKSKKIGYLGLDVYEYEKGLFFEDHEVDEIRDPLFSELLSYPNVLISPHQAFLTKEALEEITSHTINIMDRWSETVAVP
ncbi:2-hydroxyacid dehydrogenase [Pedobacter gandavensis]|uniref:2-hydroxyacid dehydrogenase n=1 Tax=Pedobacter TaxID=84567 RepID=UPI001C992A2E|nr:MULTISPECIES: 2-hydroxyacid dehydrogenase [Pedobacter]WGQ09847.1 2-hydroxyacid dehydrogenase [Pedobacter gandavensis]